MTYVMSDIHGNYQKFLALLEQIHFGERDVLYLVGDLVDYGEENMELLADLSMRWNVYSIAGEHDFTAARMLRGFDKMLKSGAQPDEQFISEMTAWVQDGGQSTLEGFRALTEEQREGVLDYLDELVLFEETEVGGKRYLLVHAGIADYEPGCDLEELCPEDFFSEPLDAAYPLMADCTVVVGHVPTQNQSIARGEGSIFLDCGAGEGGRLGCLCLETGKEFYA